MSLPPLVLIHGYPLNRSLWDLVTAFLDPELTVYVPDLRGFGDHPLPDDAEPALERMADDIAKLLEERQIPRAVLAGMSMGGYVALAFAERYSEFLAGIALVNSQAAADPENTKAARRQLIQRVREEGSQAAAKAIAEKLFAPENARRAELLRFPLQGAEKAGADGIAWALEAMARRPDRTHVLSALKVPILVLHGARDQLIPSDRSRYLAKNLPNAEYIELPDAGHASPLEAPQPVAEALRRLVHRCAPPHPGQ